MNSLPEDPRLSAAVARVGRPALVVGVVLLAACAAGAVARPDQFFRSYLLAFVFWNGLATGAMAILMLQYLTGGAWGVSIRRELEAAARTLPLTALAFLPLLAGLHRLYEWTHADVVAADEVLRQKTLYLNTPFFVVRAAVAFGAWLAALLLPERVVGGPGRTRRPQAIDRKLQLLSGGGLVVYALTTTFTAVDWVMSLEPHWFSTMYGVLFMVGQGLGALALATATVLSLSNYEPLSEFFGDRHRHDLGKMMFAFTMLWAYVELLPVPDRLVRQPPRGNLLVSRPLPRRVGMGRARGPRPALRASVPAAPVARGERESGHARRGGGAAARHALRGRRMARPPRVLEGRVPARLDGSAPRRSAWAASGSSCTPGISPAGRSCPFTTPASRRRSRMDATEPEDGHSPGVAAEPDRVSRSLVVRFGIFVSVLTVVSMLLMAALFWSARSARRAPGRRGGGRGRAAGTASGRSAGAAAPDRRRAALARVPFGGGEAALDLRLDGPRDGRRAHSDRARDGPHRDAGRRASAAGPGRRPGRGGPGPRGDAVKRAASLALRRGRRPLRPRCCAGQAMAPAPAGIVRADETPAGLKDIRDRSAPRRVAAARPRASATRSAAPFAWATRSASGP